MGKKMKRTLSMIMAGALILGMTAPEADAAKKMSLSKKKVTVGIGKKTTLKVKGAKKKVKWSVKKGKKYVSLSKKKKTSVVIKGKKAGKAVVQATIGKKKLTCKVTVKKVKAPIITETQATMTPATTVAPVTSTAPSQTPSNTATVPTATPDATQAPVVEVTQTPVATANPNQEAVKDIVIDLTNLNTTCSSPSAIDFSSQIESRFDLSLFSTIEVTYETAWASEDAKAAFNCCKFGFAKVADDLTGYADGVAYQYASSADGGTTSIDLEGVKGTVVGVNVQAMSGEDNNWAWPEGLTEVKVTAIKFVARPGVVYPDPSAPVEPTEAPDPALPSVKFTYGGLDTSWIDPAKPMVAFTFDDGPIGTAETSNSIKIQNMLRDAGAHATFFYIGKQVDKSEDTKAEVKRAQELGFEVGNHSYDWSKVNNYEKEELDESIGATTAILSEITGYDNFLFRAPNLAVSQTMKDYIPSPFVNCSVDSKDWDGATAKEIVENVTAAKDGAIVLMHETQKATVEALPEIIAYFQEQGYQIVSVSELFDVRGKDMMTGVVYSSCPPAAN